MTVLDVARAHRAETTKLSGAAHRKVLRDWKRVDPDNIVPSWQRALPAAAAALAAAQWYASIDAEAASLAMIEAQDLDVDGPLIEPAAFAGTMQATGATVEAALAGVAFHTLDRIGEGLSPQKALTAGAVELARLSNVAVFDAARAAAGTFGVTRSAPAKIGYTRMAMPGCCVRCSLLVGRWFRWNTGFDRHPSCRCVHVPAEEKSPEGMLTDPYELFEALTEAEQNRVWTKAGAEAIRDGADIYQVGNTLQKRRADGTRRSANRRFERSTKRSYYRTSSEAGRAGKHRLSVSEIYRRADGSKERARALLEEYGYITGSGQVAGGVIQLPGEGFGQFGRGGARRGAREAILRARRTGIRDPNSRYTMTAAELRAFYARQRAA